ncbi:hypothetical protein C8Q77DRAFT_300624 [Trametes polyzona]|nr:hypothetical protein C8Q77DRAFT_300624 [Trametes polyzona]
MLITNSHIIHLAPIRGSQPTKCCSVAHRRSCPALTTYIPSSLPDSDSGSHTPAWTARVIGEGALLRGDLCMPRPATATEVPASPEGFSRSTSACVPHSTTTTDGTPAAIGLVPSNAPMSDSGALRGTWMMANDDSNIGDSSIVAHPGYPPRLRGYGLHKAGCPCPGVSLWHSGSIEHLRKLPHSVQFAHGLPWLWVSLGAGITTWRWGRCGELGVPASCEPYAGSATRLHTTRSSVVPGTEWPVVSDMALRRRVVS